jgi:hypothetical protein
MPIVTGLTLGGFAQAVLGGILGAIVVRQVAGAPGGSARTPPSTGLPALPGAPGLPGLPASPGLPPGTVKGVDCAECGGDGCAACLVGVDDLDGLDEVGADEVGVEGADDVGRYYPAWATSRILRDAYLRDRRARGILGVEREDGAGFMAPHAQPHPERRDREGHLYGHEGAATGTATGAVETDQPDRVDGWGIPYHLSASRLAIPVRIVNDALLPASFTFSPWSLPARVVTKGGIPVRDAHASASLPYAAATPATPTAPPPGPPSPPNQPAAPLPARPPPAKTSGWEASLAGA